MSDTAEFFRGRIDQMIDLRHPLVVLGTPLPWQAFFASLACCSTGQPRLLCNAPGSCFESLASMADWRHVCCPCGRSSTVLPGTFMLRSAVRQSKH